jgi:hypothetical protein
VDMPAANDQDRWEIRPLHFLTGYTSPDTACLINKLRPVEIDMTASDEEDEITCSQPGIPEEENIAIVGENTAYSNSPCPSRHSATGETPSQDIVKTGMYPLQL